MVITFIPDGYFGLDDALCWNGGDIFDEAPKWVNPDWTPFEREIYRRSGSDQPIGRYIGWYRLRQAIFRGELRAFVLTEFGEIIEPDRSAWSSKHGHKVLARGRLKIQTPNGPRSGLPLFRKSDLDDYYERKTSPRESHVLPSIVPAPQAELGLPRHYTQSTSQTHSRDEVVADSEKNQRSQSTPPTYKRTRKNYKTIDAEEALKTLLRAGAIDRYTTPKLAYKIFLESTGNPKHISESVVTRAFRRLAQAIEQNGNYGI
jgi:hypothetical protein